MTTVTTVQYPFWPDLLELASLPVGGLIFLSDGQLFLTWYFLFVFFIYFKPNYYFLFGPNFAPLCAFLCTVGSPSYSHLGKHIKFWRGDEDDEYDLSMFFYFLFVYLVVALVCGVSGFLSATKITQIKVACLPSVKKGLFFI